LEPSRPRPLGIDRLAGCWVEFGEELPDAAVDLGASLPTVPFSEPSP
jgi:hypothetical protein